MPHKHEVTGESAHHPAQSLDRCPLWVLGTNSVAYPFGPHRLVTLVQRNARRRGSRSMSHGRGLKQSKILAECVALSAKMAVPCAVSEGRWMKESPSFLGAVRENRGRCLMRAASASVEASADLPQDSRCLAVSGQPPPPASSLRC